MKADVALPPTSSLTDKVDIIMSTFSKSFASLNWLHRQASADIIDFLRHKALRPLHLLSLDDAGCTAATLAALEVDSRASGNCRSIYWTPGRLCAQRTDTQGVRDPRKQRQSSLSTPMMRCARSPLTAAFMIKAFMSTAFCRQLLRQMPACCSTSLMASRTEELLDEAMDIIDRVVKE